MKHSVWNIWIRLRMLMGLQQQPYIDNNRSASTTKKSSHKGHIFVFIIFSLKCQILIGLYEKNNLLYPMAHFLNDTLSYGPLKKIDNSKDNALRIINDKKDKDKGFKICLLIFTLNTI